MIGIISGALVYCMALWVLTLVAVFITLHFDYSEDTLMSAIIAIIILSLGVVIAFWSLIIALLIGLFI